MRSILDANGVRVKLILFAMVLFLVASVQAAVTISQASGSVQYERSGSAAWGQAARGLALSPGDSIRTGDRARAIIDFDDGSRVEFGPDCEFTLAEQSAAETILRLDIGGLRAWVAHRFGQRFSVKTPTAVCTVRGTEFTIKVNPSGDTHVEMISGVLSVKDMAGKEVMLRDKQRLEVTKKGLGTVEASNEPKSNGNTNADNSGQESGGVKSTSNGGVGPAAHHIDWAKREPNASSASPNKADSAGALPGAEQPRDSLSLLQQANPGRREAPRSEQERLTGDGQAQAGGEILNAAQPASVGASSRDCRCRVRTLKELMECRKRCGRSR